MKINQHIEIVRSSKKPLSSMSQVSSDAILAMLSKHYSHVGVSIVNNLADLEALIALKPDLVFLGMKFVPLNPSLGWNDKNKIWITDYLDREGIAYTGSSQIAQELELNKPMAKQRVADSGLNTSAFNEVLQNITLKAADHGLTYPLFIKPTDRGGGLGIDSSSVVHNSVQLQLKINSLASDFQSDALVEEYLPGREFSVAILKDEITGKYSVMPIELVAPADEHGDRILSSQIKTADSEKFIEIKDKDIKAAVNELAINVFHVLGAQDYGRIDIRLDKDGVPQFLEANLIPSLIEGYGNFPKACLLNMKMDYETIILQIVHLGLSHKVSISDILLDAVAAPIEGLLRDPLLPLPEAV